MSLSWGLARNVDEAFFQYDAVMETSRSPWFV